MLFYMERFVEWIEAEALYPFFLRSIKKELYADREQAYIFLLRLFSTDKDCKKGVYQVFALKRYACIALRTGLFKKTMHSSLGRN